MSDSKFEYIDDVILDVDKDRVEKKKKSPVKPLALLILGAAILWYGANYINTAQSDTLCLQTDGKDVEKAQSVYCS